MSDPDDHLFAQQQAALDDETVELIKLLSALPKQSHYLRDRQQAPTVWEDKACPGDEHPEPWAQHVLSVPNGTVMLNRKGDDIWLGGIQLTQHVTDSKLEEFCKLAAADIMSPDMPWRQQWQYVGTRKIPEPRLSCVVAWTNQQTLYHGRNPGTSRHCLTSGFASLGTINDLPLSVKDLAVYVMTQTPAKKYNFLDTPYLIMVQPNGYRPESLSLFTANHAERMDAHTDGASVDQDMPKYKCT